MYADAKGARKMLLGRDGLGYLAVLIFMLVFFPGILRDEMDTLRGIATDAPMLRIYPLMIMMPTSFALVVVVYVGLLLAAIPIRLSIGKIIGRFVLFLIWFTFLLMLIGLIFGRPVQQYYFPKHGYTQCDQLHGNPTIWFTDWVRNPAWCVRGKDRSWVFEQARLSQEGQTAVTDAGATK